MSIDNLGVGRLFAPEDIWELKKLAERDLVGVSSKKFFDFEDSSGRYVFNIVCERRTSEFFCRPCDSIMEAETGVECPFCGGEMSTR
jgi:hypothetical protein